MLVTIRVLIITGLFVQTTAVGFYFLMGTGTFLLDALFLSFHYWTFFAWSMYCAMAIIIAANIHLITRLANTPLQLEKHFLDILAPIACVAVPGWVNLSYVLKGDWTYDSHMFYAVPTMFNCVVFCIAAIPVLHKKMFGRDWGNNKDFSFS